MLEPDLLDPVGQSVLGQSRAGRRTLAMPLDRQSDRIRVLDLRLGLEQFDDPLRRRAGALQLRQQSGQLLDRVDHLRGDIDENDHIAQPHAGVHHPNATVPQRQTQTDTAHRQDQREVDRRVDRFAYGGVVHRAGQRLELVEVLAFADERLRRSDTGDALVVRGRQCRVRTTRRSRRMQDPTLEDRTEPRQRRDHDQHQQGDTSQLVGLSLTRQGSIDWRVGGGRGGEGATANGKFLAAPTYHAGRLYVISSFIESYYLLCLSADTGEEQWWTPQVKRFVSASEDRLYCISESGDLLVIDQQHGSKKCRTCAGCN